MECRFCQKQIPDDAKLCPYCGKKLGRLAEVQRVRGWANINGFCVGLGGGALFAAFAVRISGGYYMASDLFRWSIVAGVVFVAVGVGLEVWQRVRTKD